MFSMMMVTMIMHYDHNDDNVDDDDCDYDGDEKCVDVGEK